jgi:hypothetical protein
MGLFLPLLQPRGEPHVTLVARRRVVRERLHGWKLLRAQETTAYGGWL